MESLFIMAVLQGAQQAAAWLHGECDDVEKGLWVVSMLTSSKVATPVNSSVSASSNQAQIRSGFPRKLQFSFRIIGLKAALPVSASSLEVSCSSIDTTGVQTPQRCGSCVFPSVRPSAAQYLAESGTILLGCFSLELDCREHAVLQSR